MATQLILLERVESLGEMGELVSVKPGYARNFLLPQRKALRASKENIAYFEAQKKALLAENDKKKKEAEKLAKKIGGIVVPLIRQASEAGQLFGSVTARDIAAAVSEASGESITRTMAQLNQNFKLLGLFPVDIALHPEVKVSVTINIARTMEEAEIQAKTGKALIASESTGDATPAETDAAEQLEGMLEEDALESQKQRKEAEQTEEAEEAKESAEKSAERAAKKAKKPKKAKAENSEEDLESGEEKE